MTLILPKQYVKNKKEFQEATISEFHKKLEAFINEHSAQRDPFFVLYRSVYDDFNPSIRRDVFGFYEQRPPLMKNSMVMFVDNRRGALFHLWTINSQGKIRFNRKAPEELKEKYKLPSS